MRDIPVRNIIEIIHTGDFLNLTLQVEKNKSTILHFVDYCHEYNILNNLIVMGEKF